MSHQDGLGDNGPETTGLSKSDDGDDRMEKKSENVPHARDRIKLKNLKNSGRLRNSPTTGLAVYLAGPATLLPSPPDLTPEALRFGNGRIRFSDDQRRRLAARAKTIGRKLHKFANSRLRKHP
jgi:hypothetical protein